MGVRIPLVYRIKDDEVTAVRYGDTLTTFLYTDVFRMLSSRPKAIVMPLGTVASTREVPYTILGPLRLEFGDLDQFKSAGWNVVFERYMDDGEEEDVMYASYAGVGLYLYLYNPDYKPGQGGSVVDVCGESPRRARILVENILETLESRMFVNMHGKRVTVFYKPGLVVGRVLSGFRVASRSAFVVPSGNTVYELGEIVEAEWCYAKAGRAVYHLDGTSHQVNVYRAIS